MTSDETRAAARAQIDFDERLEHLTQLQHLLDRAAGELNHLRELAKLVPSETAAPDRVLAVVAGLSKSGRIIRQKAVLDNLLTEAGERAVRLARVHGASWAVIGDALDQDKRNTAATYKKGAR